VRSFARLPADERAVVFSEAAARRGIDVAIVEKDFWVCWLLDRLYILPDQPRFVFKGGTSLSKAYGAIFRFSEDVDISIDRSHLGFSGDKDPAEARSGKAAGKLVASLVAAVHAYVSDVLEPTLARAIDNALGPRITAGWNLTLATSADGSPLLNFAYPSHKAAEPTGYIPPLVILEPGARGEPAPTEHLPVSPYAAEDFPALFSQPATTVEVLSVNRTFWEKATLLHAEFHRPADKTTAPRLSRHYYDLAQLATGPHRATALSHTPLLHAVADHKDLYFRSSWARYDTARPGTLRLAPPKARLQELRDDYVAMRPMFFNEPPRFDEVLEVLADLEAEINGQP